MSAWLIKKNKATSGGGVHASLGVRFSIGLAAICIDGCVFTRTSPNRARHFSPRPMGVESVVNCSFRTIQSPPLPSSPLHRWKCGCLGLYMPTTGEFTANFSTSTGCVFSVLLVISATSPTTQTALVGDRARHYCPDRPSQVLVRPGPDSQH